jgi:hypothetical protein
MTVGGLETVKVCPWRVLDLAPNRMLKLINKLFQLLLLGFAFGRKVHLSDVFGIAIFFILKKLLHLLFSLSFFFNLEVIESDLLISLGLELVHYEFIFLILHFLFSFFKPQLDLFLFLILIFLGMFLKFLLRYGSLK